MNVQATASSATVLESTRQRQWVGRGKNVSAEAIGPSAPPTDDRAAERPTSDKPNQKPKFERAHGVLRLLAAGHFNAVAEQRLRANFADLLPAPDADSKPRSDPDGPGSTDSAYAAFPSVDASSPDDRATDNAFGRPAIYVDCLA